MSAKLKTGIVLFGIAALGATLYWWMHEAPRRESLACLAELDSTLHSGPRNALLSLVVVPATVRERSFPEQSEFLAKALKDEISAEGLAMLRRRGDYGPLLELFPAEAEAWAKQAGVKAEDCVAFKLERNGLRAEVVLLKPSPLAPETSSGRIPYLVVRLNNVKQMADFKPVTAEQTP